MANEITVNSELHYVKGGVDLDRARQDNVTVSGTHQNNTIQAVTTAAVNVAVGSVATLGWAWMRNLDATNYVTVGRTDGGTYRPFTRLKPNEPPAKFRLEPGIALQAQANTATCDVEIWIIED